MSRSKIVVSGSDPEEGPVLVCGTANGDIILAHLSTGEERARFVIPKTPIVDAVVGGHGVAACGAMDTVVRRFDLKAGASVINAPARKQRRHVLSIAMDAAGRHVASGHANAENSGTGPPIFVQDASTMRPVAELAANGDCWDLAFSPGDELLASATADRVLRLWDTTTWKPKAERPLPATPVAAVAFHPHHAILATGHSEAAERPEHPNCSMFWSLTLAPISDEVRPPNGSSVRRVAFHPDGSLFAQGTQSGHVVLWHLDVARDRVIAREPRTLAAQVGSIHSLDFDSSGTYMITAAHDGAVRVWHVSSWEMVWGSGRGDPEVAPNDFGFVSAAACATGER